jgi:hypothetical protein
VALVKQHCKQTCFCRLKIKTLRDKHVYCSLLGCDAVQVDRELTAFGRSILPLSSG